MEGCIAPSEVPGISTTDASSFGKIAEDLIYMDFCAQHQNALTEIYADDNNPASYLYFLKSRNDSLQLASYAGMVRDAGLGMVRPDILIHTSNEKAFYEIKPDSASGRRDGIKKVGTLSATYMHFNLPYAPGLVYKPGEITVATFTGQLTVKLKIQLIGPGLIVYKLCANSTALLDLATLAALLRYIINKMNEQKGARSFRPIDLRPAFTREGELFTLAKALGLVMTSAAVAVGWKYFWKAVAKRFAARGATAALLAAADGPLPVGDLIAAGFAVWTVIDIIRLSSVLWTEAAVIAKQEA
jgi:hypothetical protein